jgi:carboxymethylenebutenolidase
MKRRYLIAGLISIITAGAFGQAEKNCCAVSSTEQFAMLASDKNFVASHTPPLPFTFHPEKGSWVTFKTADGSDARAFEVKADKPTPNVIFMVHEWWGLNDYIQQEAEKLQKTLGNVTVLALDLYDKKVAATQEDAGKYMGEVKAERAQAIINGAIKYVGPNARIGTIGWCFGGGWSLQAAILSSRQCRACVMYYGMPEKDIAKIKTLRAPVLGIFAKQDGWVTPAVVNEFETTMKENKKNISVRWYDAVHAFANPSNPKYDKPATEDAYARVVSFFKKNLVK